MELKVTTAKQFNADLKAAIKTAIGLKVKVRVINSYKFPRCWVEIVATDNQIFSNEFRLKVFDACGFDRKNLINAVDLSYGNIRKNMIAAHVPEWVKVFETL